MPAAPRPRTSPRSFALVTTLIGAALAAAACVTVIAVPTTWTAASPDPGVVNLTPASFAPGSGVTPAVQAECFVERDLPQMIARWAPVPVVLTEQPGGGARVLTLEVTHILAPGGGPWTGPKSMTVHGELLQPQPGAQLGADQGGADSTAVGWELVGSFDVRRTTTRGGGTCEMLDIISDAIAKDIRPWLANPTLNAPLGEL